MRTKRLTVEQRREIFNNLVMTQDVIPNVPRSRQMVMEKYDITEAQLKQIEDEGIDKEWPPLSDNVVAEQEEEQEVGS